MGWLDKALGFLPLVGDIWSAAQAGDAQRDANRTNIRLAREQRSWEEDMANTAVQRRRRDIEKAGFNPVLAATGPGAATPSISAPTTEPTFRAEWTKGAGTQALLFKAQLDNIRAQTAATAADARSKNVDADIKEELRDLERDFKANRYVESKEWDDLKTAILRNQDVSTGAEAKRLRDTVDSMVQMARQQAEAGKLDLEALRNIATVGGIEAGKTQGILKLILDVWRTARKD